MGTQLARQAYLEALVPLGDKIKQLRKERGWGQDTLAQKVGTVAPQISRYETGKILPSTDMVVKLAEALDASIDYLLVEGSPRRSLKQAPNGKLSDRIEEIDELSEEDQQTLLRIADALLTRNRLRQLASGAP